MKFIITILLAVGWTKSFSQYAEPELNSSDSLKTSYLKEFVISANKIPEQRRTISQQVKIISPTTIRNLNAQTSADLLQNTGVVSIQKSQQGGGSPMLRGFEASRVLLMIDGVRMNNAIYRAGHLQNVITIDNNILDRAEVLFGPSSTMYGSDALGGVVHFFTKNPELSPGNTLLLRGNAFTRVSSVNKEFTGHVDFNLAGKKFGSLTSFTVGNFGDLKMGKKKNPAYSSEYGLRPFYAERSADNTSDVLVANNDQYIQKFSGYKQYDLLQKFIYKQSEKLEHLVNFQYSTSTDIPRYDRLTDTQGSGLRSAQWYYGPQKRLMASYQMNLKNLGAMADGLVATLSYQDIEESRHDRRFNSNNLNHRIENIKVLGLTVDMNKSVGKNKIRYGFDSQLNDLTSKAQRENISTGVITSLDTRYPDGKNSVNYWAVYGSHTLEINENWTLNDGVRVGGSSLNSYFIEKAFFPFPYDNIKQKNTYASGNLGIIFTPSSWKVSLMTSTGFRVPNIDDLAKVFESVQGSTTTTGILIVPNPDLKPEKTINADLSITKFFGERARLEAVVFATDFRDAIVTQPSTFNGQSTIPYNGFPANVMSSQNAGKAYLYGYSTSGRMELTKFLSINASYNYTYGRVKNDSGPETPLDHIAPAFGRVGINYSSKKIKGEFFSNFNGWKRLRNYSANGEDNLQYATPEGMPSWYTLNMRLSYELNNAISLQIGADNLLDLQYRLFASGTNAPGRNIFTTLRVKF